MLVCRFYIAGKIILFIQFALCLSSSDCWSQGTWQSLPDFPGTSRYAATGFSINGKGYVITGYHSSGPVLLKDTWEYDPLTGTWTQKADFPGTARWYASSFSIAGKGYVGMGEYTKDIWEFDPVANTWTQKNNFPGPARAEAVGFSIGNKGYLGMGAPYGTSNFMDDFWEYNSLTDSWIQLPDFPGGPRGFAVSFTIGNKGYVGTGQTLNYNHQKDLWEFDPANGTWTQKQDLPLRRSCAVSFTIGNYGYVGMGQAPGEPIPFPNDNWRYDPVNDHWDSVAPLPYYKWALPVTFTLYDTAYVATGFPAESKCWKYSETNLATSLKMIERLPGIEIFPNPAPGRFTVKAKREGSFSITNELGQVVARFLLSSTACSVAVEDLDAGVYFIAGDNSNEIHHQKVIVVNP